MFFTQNSQHLPTNFQHIIKPSSRCQVCLSDQQQQNDYIITCNLCRSVIHQTHYGSELLISPIPQTWYCERCRIIINQNQQNIIKCQFCPNLRGIMKQYMFQKKKIWIHPQCAAWPYPTIYFVNRKKQAIKKQKAKYQQTYFWVRDYDKNQSRCTVCQKTDGLRLKCKYYSCQTSFHVNCGQKLGVIRDLESMRIQGSGSYFPVYCQQHLQKRIEDYTRKSIRQFQNGNQNQGNHFHKQQYDIEQLWKLKQARQKYRNEEQGVQKLVEYYESRKEQQESSDKLNFNLSGDISFQSHESGTFYRYLQKNIINQFTQYFPQNLQQLTNNQFNLQNISSQSFSSLQQQVSSFEPFPKQQKLSMQIQSPDSPQISYIQNFAKQETQSKAQKIDQLSNNFHNKDTLSINEKPIQLQSDNSQLYYSNSSIGSLQEFYKK